MNQIYLDSSAVLAPSFTSSWDCREVFPGHPSLEPDTNPVSAPRSDPNTRSENPRGIPRNAIMAAPTGERFVIVRVCVQEELGGGKFRPSPGDNASSRPD